MHFFSNWVSLVLFVLAVSPLTILFLMVFLPFLNVTAVRDWIADSCFRMDGWMYVWFFQLALLFGCPFRVFITALVLNLIMGGLLIIRGLKLLKKTPEYEP